MLHKIAVYEVFGLEVVILLGIVTFLSLIGAAVLGLTVRGKAYKVRRKWHIRVAILAIVLASTHATLVLLGNP